MDVLHLGPEMIQVIDLEEKMYFQELKSFELLEANTVVHYVID